jgi:hypothetical protein
VTVDQQWPAWTLVAATAALSIALLRLGRHLKRPAKEATP